MPHCWKSNATAQIKVKHFSIDLTSGMEWNQILELNQMDKLVFVCFFGSWIYGPCREKPCLRGFRQSEIQTSLLSYRDYLENWNFTCSKFTYETFQTTKNKGADQTRGCAGWSATLLFAPPPPPPPEDRFSRDEAHIHCNNKIDFHKTWRNFTKIPKNTCKS